MNKGKPSKTAEQVAISRYIESTKSADERLCYDPYAHAFITTKLYSLLPKSKTLRTFAAGMMALLVRGHHYYVIMRTRYIDDYLIPLALRKIRSYDLWKREILKML